MSFGGVGAAYAAISGLTNTGVDVDSNSVDQAWSIVGGSSVPGLTYPSYVYANTVNGVFPVTAYWVPNSSTSMWDTPFDPLNSSTDPSVNGSYVYQTTFSVTGTPAATNTLSFKFAADNEVAWITLNGQSFYTGPTDGSSQYWGFSPLITATNLITSGVNTLQFDVINYAQNGGNPSGLNVQFTSVTGVPEASVTGVPEASTWAMMLAGFAGLGFAAFRQSRKTSTAIA
jgi:hypothetical protein